MNNKEEIRIGTVKLSLIKGDITKQNTDAVVNAANPRLMGGGGVDGAIHRAGGPIILKECSDIIAKIGQLETGKAVITSGGNLDAKFIIHTVGPIWGRDAGREADLLESAYRECLKLADSYKLRSIAFPSISTGVYQYPVRQAARIALNTILKYISAQKTSLENILMVLFNLQIFQVYSEALHEFTEIQRSSTKLFQ